MSLSDDFKTFVEGLIPTNISDMETTVEAIAEKLNKSYYNIDSMEENMYIVGSVGRSTASKGVSDLDIIFNLPYDVYKKYDGYKTNGQSYLLQEVKNVLMEKYPKTKMRGDGQVVVLEFSKYTVELVPGFKQSDESFKYPNTNNGGSWKITKPIDEIRESNNTNNSTLNNNFRNVCRMMRAWKNNQGFIFGGLLIDTLTYNFFNDSITYKYSTYYGYLNLLKALFAYLKDKDEDQSYWNALGSGQKVYNSGNGAFAREAKKVYDKIKDLEEDSDNINSTLREIFGRKFPKSEVENRRFERLLREYDTVNTEVFIDDIYTTNIQYNLRIDCEITQQGFRTHNLRYMLSHKILLMPGKKMKFFVANIDDRLTQPYEIIWKVRNNGETAIKKKEIRGQLITNKGEVLREESTFNGPHFVECYIIKDGACVAKERINVPITT